MLLKDRLRALREAEGQTQKQCAQALEVSYDNYNKWENGKAPNFETLASIAKYYKTTTDYLLGLSDERYAPEMAALTKWESSLLSQTSNMLNDFFIKYNEYQKSPDAFDLARIFYVAIKGSVFALMENQKKYLTRLANIKENEKMSDIDKLVEDYLSDLGEIRCGDLSDFEIELWLRELMEENIPGYFEYRDKKINEWIKELSNTD